MSNFKSIPIQTQIQTENQKFIKKFLSWPDFHLNLKKNYLVLFKVYLVLFEIHPKFNIVSLNSVWNHACLINIWSYFLFLIFTWLLLSSTSLWSELTILYPTLFKFHLNYFQIWHQISFKSFEIISNTAAPGQCPRCLPLRLEDSLAVPSCNHW